jgi:phosphotransferase system enzyme I (PtsI)
MGPKAERHLARKDVESAIERLDQAMAAAVKGLESIQTATAAELGIQDAAIYGAQIAVIHDPTALKEIRQSIREDLLVPESAVQALLERLTGHFEALEGGDIKNWAADLRDPWFAVLRELSDADIQLTQETDETVILVAEELAPSLVTRLPRQQVAGILCARGGRFSHGAVVARSFGIPAVTGLEGVHLKAKEGERCVVFGEDARALLGARASEVKSAQKKSTEHAQVQKVLSSQAQEKGRLGCGHPVSIFANIESPRDLEMFDRNSVAGVGLFRTEFAYMERPAFPSLQEQEDLYLQVLRGFSGKPVVFRTLDVGGDKPLRYFKMPKEANPAMGWRGLRLSLEWKDLFLVQVQALLQANAISATVDGGIARVMLPMVTTVEELREAKTLLSDTLGKAFQEIEFGIMVEVPAAAMALKDMVKEVDFVSVGTNDLAQYLFAVDRDNPWVANLYQPYHPALLRTLRYIAKTCQRAGVPSSVCGEMAGHRAGALFLAGAGFDGLSMAPPFVGEIKALLRETDFESLRILSSEAALCTTSGESFGMLRAEADRAWAEVLEKSMGGRP